MIKTLSEANKIESEVYTKIREGMDLLDNIHCWGDKTLDRDKLWELRARMQDAIRVMDDLKPLRKGLK